MIFLSSFFLLSFLFMNFFFVRLVLVVALCIYTETHTIFSPFFLFFLSFFLSLPSILWKDVKTWIGKNEPKRLRKLLLSITSNHIDLTPLRECFSFQTVFFYFCTISKITFSRNKALIVATEKCPATAKKKNLFYNFKHNRRVNNKFEMRVRRRGGRPI